MRVRSVSSAPVGHRLDGVQDEVEEELLHLEVIGEHHGLRRRQLEHDLDPVLAQLVLGQLDDVAEVVVERGGLGAGRRRPREVEEVRHGVLDALDAVVDQTQGSAGAVSASSGLARIVSRHVRMPASGLFTS